MCEFLKPTCKQLLEMEKELREMAGRTQLMRLRFANVASNEPVIHGLKVAFIALETCVINVFLNHENEKHQAHVQGLGKLL